MKLTGINSLVPLILLLPSAVNAAAAPTAATAASVTNIVEFLQTLQVAQVASMPCLITLVNMTQSPIGTCLGLSTLAPLLMGLDTGATTRAATSKTAAAAAAKRAVTAGTTTGATAVAQPADFATGLGAYLGQVCKGTACTDLQIQNARGQLAGSCNGQTGGGLVTTLMAMLDNYQSGYKTLACSVYFNGTAGNCVADAIVGVRAANNPQFFMDLVSGQNLQQYTDPVFKSATCSGCVHELYKAAVFLIPNIRGQSITNDMGNHLKNDCGSGPTPNWPSVMDQTMPIALTVQQNTQVGGVGRPVSADRGGGRKRAGQDEVVRALLTVLAGVGVVGM